MATSKNVNKFGLSRHIDEGVARAVRKACGYGCVRCGSGLYEYEHIDPEFSEAREHEPEKIALLCGACHSAVTRKALSKKAIKQARANPWCLQNGYAHDFLELPDGPVGINLGNTRAECNVLLQINGWPIIWFEDAEEHGGPKRLNAWFSDDNGRIVARINRNKLRIFDSTWDVKMVGARLTIGNPREPRVLVIERVGGDEIRLISCNLKYFDWQLRVTEDGSLNWIQNGVLRVRMNECSMLGVGTAFKIGSAPSDARARTSNMISTMRANQWLVDHVGKVCGFAMGNRIVRLDGAIVADIDTNQYIWRVGTHEFIGRLFGNTIVVDSEIDPIGNPAFALPSFCPSHLLCDGGLPNATMRLFSP